MGCGNSIQNPDTSAQTPPTGDNLKESRPQTAGVPVMVTIKVELGTITAMGTFQGKPVGQVYMMDSATVDELHRKIRSEIIKAKRATQLLDLNPKKTIKQNKLKNGHTVNIIFDDEDPSNESFDGDGYDKNIGFIDLPTMG